MKIDTKSALKILEEEAQQIRTIHVTGAWVDLFESLGALCRIRNKTMIAMLGTAILAKATETKVDVFSLQVGEDKSSNTYSARALCKEVLAANANRLGIDLGVTGREPLNNQPFFGKSRISSEMKVRTDAQAALGILVEALTKLDRVTTQKEARNILRAFLQVRRRKVEVITVAENDGDFLSEEDLLDRILDFVNEDSEGGKRAQAVAAGLLDTMYGDNRIVAKRINDPSRNMPGDIGILELGNDKTIERVFEVKDKPITIKDLELLIDSVRRTSTSKVAMLAVSYAQESIDTEISIRWAEARQIRLRVFIGWKDLLHETLFWSSEHNIAIGCAVRQITKRIIYYEVSKEGFQKWTNS